MKSRSRSPRPRLDTSGFTLLEMSVVLVLLGILTGVALPNMQKPYARYQLHVAARQLASDIRYLEQLAQSKESDSYKISFDYANDQYYLQQNTSTLPEGCKKLPGSVKMRPTTFPGNVLIIKSNGAASNGGHIPLYSKTGAGDLYVIVYQHTGRVRISKEPP